MLNSNLLIWWCILIIVTMEVSQIMKLGKGLGLEGAELLRFIERTEKEAFEREERKDYLRGRTERRKRR